MYPSWTLPLATLGLLLPEILKMVSSNCRCTFSGVRCEACLYLQASFVRVSCLNIKMPSGGDLLLPQIVQYLLSR
jgi:hypothetical protein